MVFFFSLSLRFACLSDGGGFLIGFSPGRSDSDVLRLQSNSPDVLALRGLVLFLCGPLPQALQHAQSVHRYNPGHKPAQRLCKRVKEVERLNEEGNQAWTVSHDAGSSTEAEIPHPWKNVRLRSRAEC